MDIVVIRREKFDKDKKSTTLSWSHFGLNRGGGVEFSTGEPLTRCAMNNLVLNHHSELDSGCLSLINIDRFRVEHGMTNAGIGGVLC